VDQKTLDAIKARCEAATPGPWTVSLGDLHCIIPEDSNGINDWHFCANAREDVPALVAEVERLQAEVERLRAEL